MGELIYGIRDFGILWMWIFAVGTSRQKHQVVYQGKLGGGFKYVLFSTRKLGKISNLTSIFFRWVGSTTKQQNVYPR